MLSSCRLLGGLGTTCGTSVTIVLESYLVWKKRYGPRAFLQHNVAEGLSPTMSHRGFG